MSSILRKWIWLFLAILGKGTYDDIQRELLKLTRIENP
jgi:hypothetical protein